MGYTIKIEGAMTHTSSQIQNHSDFWKEYQQAGSEGWNDSMSETARQEVMEAARQAISNAFFAFFTEISDERKIQRAAVGIPEGPNGNHNVSAPDAINHSQTLAAMFDINLKDAQIFGWPGFDSEWSSSPDFVISWKSNWSGTIFSAVASTGTGNNFSYNAEINLDQTNFRNALSNLLAASIEAEEIVEDAPTPAQNTPWHPRPVPSSEPQNSLPSGQPIANSLDKMSGYNWAKEMDLCTPILTRLPTFATYYPGLPKDKHGPYIKGERWGPKLDEMPLPIPQQDLNIIQTREYQLNYHGYEKVKANPNILLPEGLANLPLPTKPQWGLSGWRLRMLQLRTWQWDYLSQDPDLEVPDLDSLVLQGEEFWCIKMVGSPTGEVVARTEGVQKIFKFFKKDLSVAELEDAKKLEAKILEQDPYSPTGVPGNEVYAPVTNIIAHIPNPDIQLISGIMPPSKKPGPYGVYRSPRDGKYYILVACPRKFIDSVPFAGDVSKAKLHDYENECQQYGGCFEAFYDLNAMSFRSAMEKVAAILRKYKRRVDNFKSSGGTIDHVDLEHEAKQLERLPRQIDDFLKYPGQGHKPEGFPDGITTEKSWLEILSRKDNMQLLHIAFGQDTAALNVCNVGIECLKDNISPRTLHLAFLYKDIISFDAKVKNTDKWQEFLSSVIYPDIKIYPSGKEAPSQDEQERKELQELNKKSILTKQERDRQVELMNKPWAVRDRARALEKRLKVKDSDSDPIFEPAFLESQEWKDFEEVYLKLFNQVDMRSVWAQILKCLSNLAGIPLTGEALCEYLFREVLKAIGIGEMRKMLGVSAGLSMGMVDGITTSAFGGTPEEIFMGEAGAPSTLQQGLQRMEDISAASAAKLSDQAGLAEHELAADSTSAIANLGYEEYQAGGSRDQTDSVASATGDVAQFMSDVSVATGDIDTFIDELKQFLDFKKVCADITQFVLDLPGDFFEDPGSVISDLTTPDGSFDWQFLEDFVPDLPNPPKFVFPELGKVTSDNGDIMDIYEDALWKISAGIVSGLMEGAMSELMNACLTEEGPGPNVGEGEYGAFENQIPAFANVAAPSPALIQAFDNYNLPADSSARFMKSVAKMLTGREMCNLFKGLSPQSILILIRGLIDQDFPEYLPALSTLPDIRMFFTHVGGFIDLQVCDEFEQYIPYVSDLCEDFDSMAGKRKALERKGFSEEEIQAQLQNELSENLNKIKDLMALMRQDPTSILKDKMPTLRCEDLVPDGILPSAARANKIVLDTIFSAIKTIFEKEAGSFKAIISPDPAREASAMAEMAGILGEMDQYVASAYDVERYGRKADGTLSSPISPETGLPDGSTIMPGRGRLVTHMSEPQGNCMVMRGLPWWGQKDVIEENAEDGAPDIEEIYSIYGDIYDDPWSNYYDGPGLKMRTPAVLLREDEWWERWKKKWPRGRNGNRHRYNNNVAVILNNGCEWIRDRGIARDDNIHADKNYKAIVDFAYEENIRALFDIFVINGKGYFPLPPNVQFGSENYKLWEAYQEETFTDLEFPEGFGAFSIDHERIVESFKKFVYETAKYPRRASDEQTSALFRYHVDGDNYIADSSAGGINKHGVPNHVNYAPSRRQASSLLIPLQDLRDYNLVFDMPAQDFASLMDSRPRIFPFQRLRDTLSNPSYLGTQQGYARHLVPGQYVPITGEEEVWTEGYWRQPNPGDPPQWIKGSYKKPGQWIKPRYEYDPENISTKHIFKIPKKLASQHTLDVLGNSSFSPDKTGDFNKQNNAIGADVLTSLGEHDPKAAGALRGIVSMAVTGKPDPTSEYTDQQEKTVSKIMDRLANSELNIEYQLVETDLLPDTHIHDDVCTIKVKNGGLSISKQIERSAYPNYFPSLLEALGMPEGEYPKTIAELFGMLVVSKIKNKIPGASPRSLISPRDFTFPRESEEEIKEVFAKYVHPKETNRILNQFRERTLLSPFFDIKFVDRFMKKLFLNAWSDICEFTGGTVSERLLGLDPLREQVDERLRKVLCRQPFTISAEDEKIAKEHANYKQLVEDSRDEALGLEAIEEAALDGLVQIRLRIAALQIMFEFMPTASVFDTTFILSREFFRNVAFERIKNQLLQESEEYYELITSRCSSIILDELKGGSGITQHPNKSYHKHTYEVDENGDGWAVEIVEPGADPKGYGRPHRHRIKNYIVHNPWYYEDLEKNYNHKHMLENSHRRQDPSGALQTIFNRQYSIIVNTVNQLMDELGYSKLRIKTQEEYAEKLTSMHFTTGLNPYHLYDTFQPSYIEEGEEINPAGNNKESGQLFISMDDPDGKLISYTEGGVLNQGDNKIGGAMMADGTHVYGKSLYTFENEKELFSEGGFVLQPYLYVQHKDKLGRKHEPDQNTKIYDVAFNRVKADGTPTEYAQPDPSSGDYYSFDYEQMLNSDPFVQYFEDQGRPKEKLNEYGVSSINFWDNVLQLIGGSFDYLYTAKAETPLGHRRPLGWNFDTSLMDGNFGLLPEDNENWPAVATSIDDFFKTVYQFDCMRPCQGVFTYKSEKNTENIDQLSNAGMTNHDEWFNNTWSGLEGDSFDSTSTNSYNTNMFEEILKYESRASKYTRECEVWLKSGHPCSTRTGDGSAPGVAAKWVSGLPFAPQETLETAGLNNLEGFRDGNYNFSSPSSLGPWHTYQSYEKDLGAPNIAFEIGLNEDGEIDDVYLNEDGTGNVQALDYGFFPVQNPNYTGVITWQSIYKQYLRALKAYRIQFYQEEGISYGAVNVDTNPGLVLDGITAGETFVNAWSTWNPAVGTYTQAQKDDYVQKIRKAEGRALGAAYDYVSLLAHTFNYLKGLPTAVENKKAEGAEEGLGPAYLLQQLVDTTPELTDIGDEFSDRGIHDQVIIRPSMATSALFEGDIKIPTSNTVSIRWQDVIDWAQYKMMDSKYREELSYGTWIFDNISSGKVFPRIYLDYGQSSYMGIATAGYETGEVDWQDVIATEKEYAGAPAWAEPDVDETRGARLTFWSGQYETVTYPAKQSVDAITLQYFADYFDCMKYGLRLLYVPPSKPYGMWPKNTNQVENEQVISKIDEAFDNLISRIEQNNLEGKANTGLKDLSNAYLASKAFDITEYTPDQKVNTNLDVNSYSRQSWRLHPIPMADVRVNIEHVYCTAGPLEFSSFKPKQAGGRGTLMSGYYQALPILLQKLRSTPEYTLLFEHIFPYNRLLSLTCMHTGLSNQDVRMENRFKATRETILDFIMSMIDQQELPFSMQKYGSVSNYKAANSATSTNAPDTAWTDIALRMLYTAPRLILKGVVTLTDPCVSTAIAINDLVMTVVQTSIMIAEQVRDGSIASIAMVIDELESQIDILKQELELAKAGIQVAELAVATAEAAQPRDEVFIDQRKQDLEEARDVVDTIESTINTISNPTNNTGALPEAENALNVLEQEVTDIINTIKDVVEALSPYMVPGISFAQMPSALPYGFLFSPPPFGPGVGPPMTSFGFIYCLLLIIEGIIDDLDGKKQSIVEEYRGDSTQLACAVSPF